MTTTALVRAARMARLFVWNYGLARCDDWRSRREALALAWRWTSMMRDRANRPLRRKADERRPSPFDRYLG